MFLCELSPISFDFNPLDPFALQEERVRALFHLIGVGHQEDVDLAQVEHLLCWLSRCANAGDGHELSRDVRWQLEGGVMDESEQHWQSRLSGMQWGGLSEVCHLLDAATVPYVDLLAHVS